MRNTHNAQYFWELTNVYHAEYLNNRFRDYWKGDLANNHATVHHADADSSIIYNIHADGSVSARDLYTSKDLGCMTVGELVGDDFEFASSILIYKSGYIVLDSPENSGDKMYAGKIMTKLYEYIASLEPSHWEKNYEGERTYPVLCGGCECARDGLVCEFQYYATNGIEVHIQNLHTFCKENENRRHFEMKAVPFIKSMDSQNSFHVHFVDFGSKGTDEEQLKKCNVALKELMGYVDSTLQQLNNPESEEEFFSHGRYRMPYGTATAKWINTKQAQPLFEN